MHLISSKNLPPDFKTFKNDIKKIIQEREKESEANPKSHFLNDLNSYDTKKLLNLDGDYPEPIKSEVKGYPKCPYYAEIASILYNWMLSDKNPFDNLPNYFMLDEKDYVQERKERMMEVDNSLKSYISLYYDWSRDEKYYTLKNIILKKLGRRGLMDLLGMRKTVGSREYWPHPREHLLINFNRMLSPNSKLSVGGRALAKHAHRDATSSWWGSCIGSEKEKSEKAHLIANKILNEASWINIHCLPGDYPTLEIRGPEGYGLRWTEDDDEFRGLLEPQMEGGHEVGWKH